ncbi:hypothetical protein J6590_044069 [Homalodisca vitripennis]|nr:hypothetical protein J6590_044069 [Homalodisca vitripennis]
MAQNFQLNTYDSASITTRHRVSHKDKLAKGTIGCLMPALQRADSSGLFFIHEGTPGGGVGIPVRLLSINNRADSGEDTCPGL